MELWSPNSEQLPYLAGALSPSFSWDIPKRPEHRRYDGHLGRYDPTISPQMFSERVPWLGLIIRPACGLRKGLPEFMPLHEYWQSSSQDEGCILPRFISDLQSRIWQLLRDVNGCSGLEKVDSVLWAGRPKKLTLHDIDLLKSLTKYDKAIDETVRVQRQARITAAWLKMAQIVLDRGMRLAPWTTIPPANDDYIGTWINGPGDHNGARSRDVLWLLHHNVPCFIAHTLTPQEQCSIRVQGVCILESLVLGTDAELLKLKDNQYDLIAYRGGCQPTKVGPILDPPPKQALPVQDRLRSSSYKQGWRGALCGYQRLPEPQYPDEDDVPSSLPLPKYVQKDWEYDASHLDYVEIDPGRVLLLRPPPVSAVAAIREKWTRWRIEHTDDGEVMRRSNCSSGGKYCFYDRALRRELHFGREVPPPLGYLADMKIFGQPVPNVYFETNAHQIYIKQNKSRWMYMTREDPSHLGQVAHVPHLKDLPPRQMNAERPAMHNFLTSLDERLVSETTTGRSTQNNPALILDPPHRTPSCNYEDTGGIPRTDQLWSPGASAIASPLRGRSRSPVTTLITSSNCSPLLLLPALSDHEVPDAIMKSDEAALQPLDLSISPPGPTSNQVTPETDVIMQISSGEPLPYRERSVSLGSEVTRIGFEPGTGDSMIMSPARNSFTSPAVISNNSPSPSGPPRDSIKFNPSPTRSRSDSLEPSPYTEGFVSLGSEVSHIGQDSMSPAQSLFATPSRPPSPTVALPTMLKSHHEGSSQDRNLDRGTKRALSPLEISSSLDVNDSALAQAALAPISSHDNHCHPIEISAPSDPQPASLDSGKPLAERIGEVRPFHRGRRSGKRHKGGKRNENMT